MTTSHKQATLKKVAAASAIAYGISSAFAKTVYQKTRYRVLARINQEFLEAVAKDPPDMETANAAMLKMTEITQSLVPEKKQFAPGGFISRSAGEAEFVIKR